MAHPLAPKPRQIILPHEREVPPAKYQNIYIKLLDESGDAFHIMGRVKRAMKAARTGNAVIEKYQQEAMSGDYDNLVATTLKWVNCIDYLDHDEADDVMTNGQSDYRKDYFIL